MNTEAIRAKFEISCPVPEYLVYVAVENRYLINIASGADCYSHGDFRDQYNEKWAGYQQAVKDMEAEKQWIKTTERLPEKPSNKNYEYVDCYIFVDGEVLERPWNCEHECWDDAGYDDFQYSATEPSHWMIANKMPLPPEVDHE